MGRGFASLSKLPLARTGKKVSIRVYCWAIRCVLKTPIGRTSRTKGYGHYKCTNGIKRHLLVDVLGTPYFVRCTAANISDDEGLLEIIKENKEYFLTLPDGHTITILLDNGYHKEYLEAELEKIEPRLREVIKIAISAKITPQQKAQSKADNPVKQGFVVIAKRWIVERTNAWINQCRVLWKNCEGLLETSETKIRICSIRLILRRIA